jgi:pimeloyl-ACP methyl ester carboxylesterase
MSSVEAVSFTNPAGLRLFGTLHQPAEPDASLPAVVLLSPGVKMRVGPGRLYVPLTDMLIELGYTVLRFDFFGLGDSEGELEERQLVDVYNHIEVGRYVGDTLAALDFLRTRGHRRFIVGGLCGGAITALLAAERDSSIEALLSLGMTVTLASNAATPAKYLSARELESAKRHYLRKLANPRAWRSFLTFKSNYGVIWRVIKRELFERKQPLPEPKPPDASAPPEQRGNANPLFPKAFFTFLERGGRALLLFSEKDRLHGEYQEKFALPYAERLKAHMTQIHQHIVANANHVLSLHEWQREMVEVGMRWLLSLYPVAAR